MVTISHHARENFPCSYLIPLLSKKSILLLTIYLRNANGEKAVPSG